MNHPLLPEINRANLEDQTIHELSLTTLKMRKSLQINRRIKLSLALLILAFGRYPLSKLVSSGRKHRKPVHIKSDEVFWIKCATGNVLHVEFDGPKEAQVIVFVHGLNSSSQMWFYQRLFFREKYRLVFIDLPGHGKSLPPKEFKINAIAEDLKEIIQYFNLISPILWGHSLGGMISMQYCIQNSKNSDLKGLVVLHATCTKSLETVALSSILQPIEKSFVIPFLHTVIKHNWFFGLLRWITFSIGISHLYLRYVFFTGNQTSEQLRFVALIAAKNSPETVAKGLLETIKFNILKDLGKITTPTLVIGGVHDRLTNLTASALIHQHIPSSEMKVVNEGHLSLVENPLEVNLAVKNFLQKL
jgi:pimeloyl-ACP methyl ester carboxylesterase